MTVVMVLACTTSTREDAGEHLGNVLHAIIDNTNGGALELIAWDAENLPNRDQRTALRALLGNDNFVERELANPANGYVEVLDV